MTPAELIDNFSYLLDWEDKYRYLIELGNGVPPMNAADKNESTKVDGCMAQVWMTARRNGNTFTFEMDSDAHIVKGLQAILLILINGKTADEIRALHLPDLFEQLGLAENLSPNRRNGFLSMIHRIHQMIQ